MMGGAFELFQIKDFFGESFISKTNAQGFSTEYSR
jgi:hypothetical protein